jgi:hypothetical protein
MAHRWRRRIDAARPRREPSVIHLTLFWIIVALVFAWSLYHRGSASPLRGSRWRAAAPGDRRANPEAAVLPPDPDAGLAPAGAVLAGGLALEWRIAYAEAGGEVLLRRITVTSIVGRIDPTHVHAYCHAAREQRHFALRRIVELVDVATGDVVADPEGYVAKIVQDAAAVRPPDAVLARRLERRVTVTLHGSPRARPCTFSFKVAAIRREGGQLVLDGSAARDGAQRMPAWRDRTMSIYDHTIEAIVDDETQQAFTDAGGLAAFVHGLEAAPS